MQEDQYKKGLIDAAKRVEDWFKAVLDGKEDKSFIVMNEQDQEDIVDQILVLLERE